MISLLFLLACAAEDVPDDPPAAGLFCDDNDELRLRWADSTPEPAWVLLASPRPRLIQFKETTTCMEIHFECSCYDLGLVYLNGRYVAWENAPSCSPLLPPEVP